MEKEINNKRTAKEKGGVLSDFALRILAVVIAIIIWFALSITQFPTTTKTITKIPVDFSLAGTTAEAKGLSALGYKDKTVDVEIEGMNYEIGTYSANDLVATVNLDEVTKSGTYQLDIDVKSLHPTDRYKIISVTPSTVEVKFDQIDTVSMDVNVSAPNVRAEEGYTLWETSVQPGKINISGPENELKKIAKVEAVYSDVQTLSDDMTITTDTLLLYDENNNLLGSSDYTIESTLVNIKFVVYKKVTSTLVPQFTDQPEGFDLSSLPFTLSADTIQIITPNLDAEPTEELMLSPISMYDISRGKTFKTDISSLLSAGEINQSGIEQVELSIDLSDYTTATFSIPAEQVEFVNVPSGRIATLDNEQIMNVTFIGPSEIIEKLKLKHIKAQVDLSDISANGSVSHEVKIYSEKFNSIWNIGTHEAVVTVSDMSAAVTSETDSSSADSSSIIDNR